MGNKETLPYNTGCLELGKPETHARNSTNEATYKVERHESGETDTRELLQALTNTLVFLAVLKNTGNVLKVFKHWRSKEEMCIFNNHSCFTAEWTEGLPQERMQRLTRRQVQ